ncbi:MAG: DUF3343 domain-containing protein [Dehalococcoidales bacterium]|jgi:hypothetical protein|nr:DUF3343 domain-containing protein [Dehalococcoidales bacterium]
MEEKDKALIVFDYIYHAMRAKHVLEEAGFNIREVAPPVDYRTGCDLAIEVGTDDVDAAEDLLIEKDVLILDILFMPSSTSLTPIYLTKLIKVVDYGDYIMVRCGNMKITFVKETGKIVNISGGGCPDIPYLGMKLYGTVLGEGPRPREIGKTICAYTCEHAYEKALEIFNELHGKKGK